MLSRLEVSNFCSNVKFIWLQLLNTIFLFPAPLTEDFCGVEPVTHPTIELETRPPPIIDEDKLRRAYNRIDSVVLGGKITQTQFLQN